MKHLLKKSIIAVTVTGIMFPAGAWAKSTVAPRPARPVVVTVGQCAEGTVKGLSPKSRASVRSLPSTRAKELDRLPSNMYAFACETLSVAGVEWVGIVYSRVAHGEECGPGVDSALEIKKYAYDAKPGPCWSGWVTTKYLAVSA